MTKGAAEGSTLHRLRRCRKFVGNARRLKAAVRLAALNLPFPFAGSLTPRLGDTACPAAFARFAKAAGGAHARPFRHSRNGQCGGGSRRIRCAAKPRSGACAPPCPLKQTLPLSDLPENIAPFPLSLG